MKRERRSVQMTDGVPAKLKRFLSLFKLTPTRIIVLAFLGFVLAGALILMLPITSKDGSGLSFIDALFTATSAVCVTGLVIVDTASHFNLFGQTIILILIQVGGLGIMTMATLIFFALRKRITLKERLVMQSALNENSHSGVVALIRNMLILTFSIEAVGALLLMPAFIPVYGGEGVFKSIFISISAFCNAGFDVMGTVDNQFVSLTGFSGNVLVVLTTCLLIILGGIGFAVILDCVKTRKPSKLTFHSKIVLVTTLTLIGGGFVFFALTEIPTAIANKTGFFQHMLNSLYNAITPRTAGFSTTPLVNGGDAQGMSLAGRFGTIALMIVGASPASTGGGIKTATLALLFFMILSGIRNRDNVVISGRQVNAKLMIRAVSVAIILLLVSATSILILLYSEADSAVAANGLFNLENIVFEVISASGTVGLSLGITPHLSPIGQLVIMVTMFIGRLGPLTIGMLFLTRTQVNEVVEFPEANIMIG